MPSTNKSVLNNQAHVEPSPNHLRECVYFWECVSYQDSTLCYDQISRWKVIFATQAAPLVVSYLECLCKPHRGQQPPATSKMQSSHCCTAVDIGCSITTALITRAFGQCTLMCQMPFFIPSVNTIIVAILPFAI